MQSNDQPKLALAPLDEVQLRQLPFPHFVATQPFASGLADATFAWLDRYALWRRHVEYFFDQFECNAFEARLPREIHDGVASPAVLHSLRRRMEAIFSVSLQDIFCVVAHRLVPGQGIGVHTDRPQPGCEGYRMVVNLGPERSDTSGGQLMFFDSEKRRDVACAFRGVHNTAVGFELSERSYHAVAEVTAGVRYSLVYSFWRADCVGDLCPSGHPSEDFARELSQAKQPHRAPHAVSGASLDSLTQVLVEAGAACTPSPESALLPDLVHTYDLLRSWGCRDELSLAGLFHGVYGTAAGLHQLVSLDQRDRIRSAIGERAEALVYACCAADEATLRQGLAEDDPSLVQDRWRRTSLGIDRASLAAIATLIMAHGVAQDARLPATDEERREQRRFLALAGPLLDSRVHEGLYEEWR